MFWFRVGAGPGLEKKARKINVNQPRGPGKRRLLSRGFLCVMHEDYIFHETASSLIVKRSF